MLTIKQIRDDKEAAARKLAKKGVDATPVIEKIISFDDRRKALQLELDNTLAAQNKAAKEMCIQNPIVKGQYQTADNPIFEVFYLEDPHGVIADFSGNPPKEYDL